MKQTSILTALAILGHSAATHADIITCFQEEPFIKVTYNTDEGTSKTEALGEDPVVHRGLKFVIKGNDRFEIRNANGDVIQILILNYEGSEGVSDLKYPFDGGQGINGPIGCESSELSPTGVRP